MQLCAGWGQGAAVKHECVWVQEQLTGGGGSASRQKCMWPGKRMLLQGQSAAGQGRWCCGLSVRYEV